MSFTAVVATSGIISSEELAPWLGRGNKHRSNERRRPVTSPAAAKSLGGAPVSRPAPSSVTVLVDEIPAGNPPVWRGVSFHVFFENNGRYIINYTDLNWYSLPDFWLKNQLRYVLVKIWALYYTNLPNLKVATTWRVSLGDPPVWSPFWDPPNLPGISVLPNPGFWYVWENGEGDNGDMEIPEDWGHISEYWRKKFVYFFRVEVIYAVLLRMVYPPSKDSNKTTRWTANLISW